MPDPIVGVYPNGTLEEGDLPDRSANYGPLSTFAAKTEEDWDAELRGAEDDRWGGLLSGLFEGLTDGISFVAALLEGLGQAIFGAVDWVWDTVTDFFDGLFGAFTGKWTFLDNTSSTATTASSQVAQILASSIASDVSGGVVVSDEFNGASANDLGSNFTRVSDGGGAGNFGPNGSGAAVWKTSGASTRRHIDRHNTVLTTDYQAVLVVPSWAGSGGNAFLVGRCDSAADNFVYAKISTIRIEIGCKVGGTWQTPFDGIDYVSSDNVIGVGDQWLFLVGTSTDDRQFILKKNGVTKLSVTDTGDVSALGASYRYCGVGAQAIGLGGFLGQALSPSLNMWAGYDRLSTSV